MGVEKSRKLTELHALGMAKRAEIKLSPEQIELYVQLRDGSYTFELPDKFIPSHQSDHAVLRILLTEDQIGLFERYYPEFHPH